MAFLTSTRCAIGALFERKTHPDLPTPLSDFFADRAKAILDMELASPRLSTIQALAILSIHEGIAIRDTRAWVYSGMYLGDTLTLLSVMLNHDIRRHGCASSIRLRSSYESETIRRHRRNDTYGGETSQHNILGSIRYRSHVGHLPRTTIPELPRRYYR